jgi:hypothetical protein
MAMGWYAACEMLATASAMPYMSKRDFICFLLNWFVFFRLNLLLFAGSRIKPVPAINFLPTTFHFQVEKLKTPPCPAGHRGKADA